jgi:hypothetical protein
MDFCKKLTVLLFFLLVGFSFNLWAQITKIRGSVVDAESGEALPFVNVSFKGTAIGTVTDFEGRFFIETRAAQDSLTISFVGYQPQVIHVKKGIYQEFNIKLKPETFLIDAVVIKHTENPAHPILRSIISNKEMNNPANYNAYSYESYNKIQVDLNNVEEEMKNRKILKQVDFVFNYIDTNAITGKTYLPIFITEAISHYYYQRDPKVEREVIKASKISGINNESVSRFTGKIYQTLNVYDNFINIFDQGLVSPISNLGLLYYKYYLIDSTFIGDRWSYQLSFKPRRKQEPTFTGDFWVDRDTWALVKIQLRLSTGVNLNFVNDMVANVEYQLVNDTLWFPSQINLFVDFNLTERTTGFFGTKTTSYRNVRLNEAIPDSISKLNSSIIVLDDALKKDSLFWNQSRPFVLAEKEAGIYSMVDSVKQVRLYKTFIDILDMFVNYHYTIGLIELGPYYKTYSFNEIEGNRYRISGRTSNYFSRKLMISAFVAYGDKDERFKYGSEIQYVFSKIPRRTIFFSYMSDIEQLGQSPYALVEDNILTSILRRNPNYKLTLVNEASGRFENEWFTGFSNALTLSHKSIFPSSYISFEPINGDPNLNQITTTSLSLSTKWIKDERFVTGEFERVSLGSVYPELFFDITGAYKGILGGQYSFVKLHFNYYHKVSINPLGYMRYIIDAGKIIGEVPYPLLKLHEGNETYAFDRFAYNMMNYYEFASDQYVSLFVEHHFQGFFLNRIPLMRRLKWREVVSGKALVGSISKANMNVLTFPDGLNTVTEPYVEVAVGVENIFKVVRVDAIWRLTHLDHPNIEKFGVRMGFQIIF